ncbi:hypothetical protein PR002_g4694 [Phytophthora rubi]|uniref:Uncharacterized protein n=1 Tax=Phytophthora rubi TaxID=129364 RepID=A0A6A3N9N1_9STRA|nr:hypothetical protein PR002_g4694 [Phytophthora rubi]
MQAFERDPTFWSSAFALVPKKDKPLHMESRNIHDLSALDGLSVNAQTASEASPDGWHEGKFTTWSRVFHAVGIDWNIPDEYITVPQRKIDKLRSVLAETLGKAFLLRKRLDSASSASSDT